MVDCCSCALRSCASTLPCSFRNSLSNIAFTASYRTVMTFPSSPRTTRSGLIFFFSYQAELWNTIWINILFVAERDWFERKYCFARLVHGLDVLLEAGRGGGDTELAT